MTTDTQTLPALPTGYTWQNFDDGYGRMYKVIFCITEYLGIIRSSYFFPSSITPFLTRDSDGVLRWKDVSEIKFAGNPLIKILAIVADSEIPEGGMTQWHTLFNETTGKYELANIESEVHRHHESEHDSDVAAAVVSICECRIDLLHRKALLANLNRDQKAKANTAYTGFDDCIDEIVTANAKPAVEHAYLKSLGDIRHNGSDYPGEEFVERANNFGAAYIGLINSKTTAQLRGRRYEYTMCLIDELNADRERTGSARFLPKDAKLVKTKSTPADATEVTLTSLFTKLRNRISPSEGPPKNPV